MIIRKAAENDLSGLVDLENRSFNYDRIDRRSFKRFLTKAHSLILVGEENNRICAYVLLLFKSNSSIARLYSIAVDSDHRNNHLGDQLAKEAEKEALLLGYIIMRMEIRLDNEASITLFTHNGYKKFGLYENYYDDGMDAVRLQKHLRPGLIKPHGRLPYYNQTLNFTCGPSALMMAMAGLDSTYEPSQHEEISIWRESTTIFMTSGHGGCGPHGLAISAINRGFSVRLYVHPHKTLFENSVRNPEKKKVIAIVQEEFEKRLHELNTPVTEEDFTLESIVAGLKDDEVIIILTSAWYINGEKAPHWVVINSIDEDFVWYHDPYIAHDKGVTAQECMDIPVPRKDFEKMCKYGKEGQKALLIVRRS